jgi:hypothetical protein
LAVSELRRLRDLEKENARLKRLLAERDLEVDALREVLGKRRPPRLSAGTRRRNSGRKV